MLQQFKNNFLVLPLRKKLYSKKFNTHENVNYFNGSFNSFEEALFSIPKNRNIGYNNSQAAKLYIDRCFKIHSTDYPVLFWLQKIMAEIDSVFDFGGHIGVSYYAYSNLLSLEHLRKWTVCDVPSVVSEGEEIKKKKSVTNLNFVTDINQCENYDLFIANGSLQFLEWELYDKLNGLVKKPRFIIFNMTPIHPIYKTITLHNMGVAFCPYYIRKEEDFFDGLKQIGYTVVDKWVNPEKNCNIPFSSERSLMFYTGAILKLDKDFNCRDL